MRALLPPLVALAVPALAACGEPSTFVPVDELGGPRGAITGSLVYSGPRPCTREGRVIGAAVILAFDERALPPPDGLATEPDGLTIISGDRLFAGIPLDVAPDGSAACPPADAPWVTTTATFEVAPLRGGSYQLRGFFDRDGDFNPAFSIFNLPTRGDIAGGALDNTAAALGGARPRFRSIGVGALDADGAWSIPSTGARVDGVAVTLGLQLPFERPMFHVGAVTSGRRADAALGTAVVIPADYELDTFDASDPVGTEASLIRLGLRAGLPAAEHAAAKAKPYILPVNDASFAITREDTNRDGVRDAEDHVPESTQIPSLAPLAFVTRIADPATASTEPLVLLQGLTLLGSLLDTAMTKPELLFASDALSVALRPAVLCIDRRDPTRPVTLLQSRERDARGETVLADPDEVVARLAKRLGRKVNLAYGCLPQGRYAMNLVYETGQAWTVPNEAGVCAASEPPSADGTRCSGRTRLASQGVPLVIGAPRDAAYCAANPTPSACLP
ncbi:MAG: hypothetical protein FJ096_15920 [Deltaproteobacteria bacterium]|nr:hypothetical protein [Deltaproteobacteria bacterium]